MTTIILVAIGILIAAAAALMMVFYGGDVFEKYSQEAEAGRLVSEGAQIESAVELYYQKEGGYPRGADPVDTLIAEDYLSHRPMGVKGGTGGDWAIDYDEGLILSVVGSADNESAVKICETARRQMKFPNPEEVPNCDGSDSPNGSLSRLEPCCIRS